MYFGKEKAVKIKWWAQKIILKMIVIQSYFIKRDAMGQYVQSVLSKTSSLVHDYVSDSKSKSKMSPVVFFFLRWVSLHVGCSEWLSYLEIVFS